MMILPDITNYYQTWMILPDITRHDDNPSPAQTPTPKPLATPKSSKKQLTKPEKRVEAMDSSQSEGEEVPEAKQRSELLTDLLDP